MGHDDSPDTPSPLTPEESALDLKYRTLAAVRHDPNMPERLREAALRFLDTCDPNNLARAARDIQAERDGRLPEDLSTL
jgi:hypothetical protein